uniref:Ovule protein n=1 Tax=Parascaris univalens TaxID=6257 RepID=A0A915BLK7_PARUN
MTIRDVAITTVLTAAPIVTHTRTLILQVYHLAAISANASQVVGILHLLDFFSLPVVESSHI